MDPADLLRKARTIGQSMQREREYKRTLHPYGRSSCAVVYSSPDPSEIRGGVDIITSPLVHLHPNTLTETHGTSAVFSAYRRSIRSEIRHAGPPLVGDWVRSIVAYVEG